MDNRSATRKLVTEGVWMIFSLGFFIWSALTGKVGLAYVWLAFIALRMLLVGLVLAQWADEVGARRGRAIRPMRWEDL